MTEYPICKRLECGCYVEIWEDIKRTDFCKQPQLNIEIIEV